MNGDEQIFEAYLRKFQPASPRALRLVRQSFGPRRAAAMAIAAAIIVVFCWAAVGRNPPANSETSSAKRQPSAISVRELTRIALDDPAQLDVRLNEAAPVIFHCCEGPRSSLAALAKE